jgi:hypothetical protein
MAFHGENMMNKKGYSMSGWTETILLSLLFVLVTGIIIANFNDMYGKNYDIGLGAQTNSSLNSFVNSQDTLASNVKGGEASFTTDGISLKSSWEMIKTIGNIFWSFITGGWIETITTNYLGLPEQVGFIFRVLYFLSIIFIIMRLLFKIKP